jgi:hypothetical protein
MFRLRSKALSTGASIKVVRWMVGIRKILGQKKEGKS